MIISFCGELSEWLKEHAWKACNGQKPFGSSNLPFSAILILLLLLPVVARSETPIDKHFESFVTENCKNFNPEMWSRYSYSQCDENISLKIDELEKFEIAHYDEWIKKTEFLLKMYQQQSYKNDLNILNWYLKNKKKLAELREKNRIIEFFSPAKDLAKNLNELNRFITPQRRVALIKKINRYKSERWIEKGWHRFNYLKSKWDDGVFPLRHEAEDYISNTRIYLDGINSVVESLNSPEATADWKTIKRTLLAYNTYVSQKILPITRESLAINEEWYQANLEGNGVTTSAKDIISIAKNDYKSALKEFKKLSQKIAKQEKYVSSNPTDVMKEFTREGVSEWVDVERKYREAEKFIEDKINQNEIVSLPADPIKMRSATLIESTLVPSPTVVISPNINEPPTYLVPVKSDGKFDPAFSHTPYITSLLAHEGRPGHDLQSRVMLQTQPSRAVMLYNNEAATYHEGWALYAEELLFPYFDDKTKLFSMSFMLLRMARAFIEPQLHLGQITITDAEKILREEVGLSENGIKSEIRRYTFLKIAQAPTYYEGLLNLRKLRENFVDEWRDKFKPKCFHDAFLMLGGRPWSQIEESLRSIKPCH